MARRLLTLSLAAGALALPAAPAVASDGCPGADDAVTALNVDASRDAIRCLVNVERTARGLNALTQNDKLQTAAQLHTENMLAHSFFDHVDPAGADPGDRITAAGYDWMAYGENIAAGYRTPRDVMTGWMQSTGHCHNVLEPGFTELGVGVTALAATLSHAVGTWTQDFGRARGTAAPGADRSAQQGCPYANLAVAGTAPAAPDATAPDESAPTPSDAPATAPTAADDLETILTLAAKRHGDRLRVHGTARVHHVRVKVRWHGHTTIRSARVRHGHYRLSLRHVPRRGKITVRARGGLVRVTRSVS